ncbi:response regulator [bacterium]|nr:response regulator [bacterium]
MNAQKTILVVDDDPDLLEQVEMILASEGYNVVTANGHSEAEETILTVRPDLAVFDLMMEQMDSGFVLCHLVKKMYPGTPVILLTAVTATTGLDFKANTDEEKSWIKADVLIDKPARAEQLKSEVKRLLKE